MAIYAAHIKKANNERNFFSALKQMAHEQLTAEGDNLEKRDSGSSDIIVEHFILDYAQSVQIPHLPFQPGSIYFRTGRRIGLFGVLSSRTRRQFNFVLPEGTFPVESGKTFGGKGSNNVVSMLHHTLSKHSIVYSELNIHADNASSQNKNNTLLKYLLCRVSVRVNSRISLHFMLPGHTKCDIDGGFGRIKSKYKISHVYTPEDMADVIDGCDRVSSAILSDEVTWFNWKEFLQQFFEDIAPIKCYQSFTMELNENADRKEGEAVILTKRPFHDSEAEDISTVFCLKRHVRLSDVRHPTPPTFASLEAFPNLIKPMTVIRLKYLHKFMKVYFLNVMRKWNDYVPELPPETNLDDIPNNLEEALLDDRFAEEVMAFNG